MKAKKILGIILLIGFPLTIGIIDYIDMGIKLFVILGCVLVIMIPYTLIIKYLLK